MQIAVDTVAHFDRALERLYMDIRRFEGNGFPYDRIDQPHGRIVDDVVHAVHYGYTARHHAVDHVAVARLLQISQRFRGGDDRHDRIDVNIYLRGRHEDKIHVTGELHRDDRPRVRIERTADR